MKNKLKLRKLKHTYELEYSDFNKFIQTVYSQKYNFVIDMEARNDSCQFFRDITGKLEDYDERDLKDFKETGEYSYLANTLLEDLCRQGHIKSGDYLIHVCW